MKLYELPRNTKFTFSDDEDKNIYLFEKIDGMYSRCFDGDELFHLSASAEVEPYIEKTEA